MNWIEVTAEFEAAPLDWSPLIDIMRDSGSANTMETEMPPSLVGCLADGPAIDERVAALSAALMEGGAATIKTRLLADEDWSQAFREHFKPRRYGKRFMVVPTWDAEFKPEPDDLIITLDPGQAFGTGDHPTTRMCLELMEEAELAGKRVADVGCGTGILTIAAVLLGAGEVAAVDIDPVSVQVANENAAQNKVDFTAIVGEGLVSLGEGWDVVISNIISATLIMIAPDAALATVTGGKWIVSGVIHANWPDVQAAAERHGFVLDQKREDEQWVAAAFRRI